MGRAAFTLSPAISEPSIMGKFPDARQNEVNTLLQWAEIQPGSKVVDVQAAAGYVSDQIQRQLRGNVTTICVEPTPAFHSRIRPEHQLCTDPIDQIQSVKPSSIDHVVGLAGLHHSPSKLGTVRAAHRILRPGGRLTLCDVQRGSRMDKWLNDFVNQHSPGGHRGNFLQPGEASKLLKQFDFLNIEEKKVSVPWTFDHEQAMVEFFQRFFALQISDKDTLRGIQDTLVMRPVPSGIEVEWELIYARGRKVS